MNAKTGWSIYAGHRTFELVYGAAKAAGATHGKAKARAERAAAKKIRKSENWLVRNDVGRD